MTAEEIERIVTTYAEIARPWTLSYFPERNSCIGVTRGTLEVFALLGLKAWPVSVRLQLKCPAWGYEICVGLNAADKERARKISKSFLSVGTKTKGYEGHLIIATEGGWLVDPTFDFALQLLGQVAPEPKPPEEDFILAMHCGDDAKLDEHFVIEIGAQIEGQECSAIYTTGTADEYKEAPGWETDHLVGFVATLLRVMRKSLADQGYLYGDVVLSGRQKAKH